MVHLIQRVESLNGFTRYFSSLQFPVLCFCYIMEDSTCICLFALCVICVSNFRAIWIQVAGDSSYDQTTNIGIIFVCWVSNFNWEFVNRFGIHIMCSKVDIITVMHCLSGDSGHSSELDVALFFVK